MNTTRFVVLAAVDDGAVADSTGSSAARYAQAARGAELHFVHVVPWVPAAPDAAERRAGIDPTSMIEAARARLVELAKKTAYAGDIVCHVAVGDPAREILQMASRIAADIVICGTHGRQGIARALLGSVAERVVRSASCPVLVMREKDYHQTLAPQIEPPCPECLARQASTNGVELWCARHTEHHPRAHLHYETPETFAVGSMLVRP